MRKLWRPGQEGGLSIGQVGSTSTFTIDLSTARPKWRLDGLGLSDRSLYLPANPAFAKIYQPYFV